MSNEHLRNAQERIKYLIETYCEGSQQRFAERCRVSKYSVSQYVNGSNAPGNLSAAKIADAFNVNPLWVMGFEEPMTVGRKKEQEHYYINDDARDLAEFLFHHPEHKVLFDASRTVPAKDIDLVRQLIDRFSEHHDD